MSLTVEIDDDLLDCLAGYMKDEKLENIECAVNEALAEFFDVEAEDSEEEEEEEEERPSRNRR